MVKRVGIYIGLLVIMAVACSKSNDHTPGGGDNRHYGSGHVFFKEGLQGIKKMDLRDGELTDVIPNWSSSGWDISWDGKTGVRKVDVDSYKAQYIVFSTADGTTITEINYRPNGNRGGLPCLSPDGTKLALRPVGDDGLVVLTMDGTVICNVGGYGATHNFGYLDALAWEPAGTILFKKDGGLWRTSTDFMQATKVRDIPLADWTGEATASPDGSRIALPAGNHIWMMNADGSDFHAVTESAQEEQAPVFSPDSRYIALRANPRAPGVSGSSHNAFHLCLIPADGQVYHVTPGEDDRVIHPLVKGETDTRGLGMTMVGDFVWRP